MQNRSGDSPDAKRPRLTPSYTGAAVPAVSSTALPEGPTTTASNAAAISAATYGPEGRFVRVKMHAGEGTYGKVFKCLDTNTDKEVAVKRIKAATHNKAGLHMSSVRELKTFQALNPSSANNPGEEEQNNGQKKETNVMSLVSVFVEQGQLHLVMPWHNLDLRKVVQNYANKNYTVRASEIACMLHQILSGVKYMHDRWFLHRDLKPDNIMCALDGTLLITDFGLARTHTCGHSGKFFDSSTGKLGNSVTGDKAEAHCDHLQMSPMVVSLWYRAPELLVKAIYYDFAIDVWSIGCIFSELIDARVLYIGRSELDQIMTVFADWSLRAKIRNRADFDKRLEEHWPDINGLGRVGQLGGVTSLFVPWVADRLPDLSIGLDGEEYDSHSHLARVGNHQVFRKSVEQENRGLSFGPGDVKANSGKRLLYGLLELNPNLRPSCAVALNNAFLKNKCQPVYLPWCS